MGEGKVYQVIVTLHASMRYREQVLPYLYQNFTFDRATEIDDEITGFIATLENNPSRGKREEYLRGMDECFRFLLFKETRHFELKIIYYIDELSDKVLVTDFFPTKMNPLKI